MVMAKWGWQRAAAVGLLWLAVSLLAPVTARADGPGGRAGGPVLVLGDSLSAEHNIPAGSGWVALLQRRLAREVKSPPAVVNASISGDTTAGALARLPALLRKHQPSVLVVELGGNDALRGLAPAQLRGNLEKILLAADQAGARVLLLGIDVPPNYGPAYRDRLRQVYAGLASQYKVALLPFLLEGVALQPGLMQGDGLHPTAKAQPKVLDNVWPLLKPLLNAPPN